MFMMEYTARACFGFATIMLNFTAIIYLCIIIQRMPPMFIRQVFIKEC